MCQRARRRVGVVPALCQSQFGKGASNGDSVWAITGKADNVAGTPFFHLGVLTNTRFLHRSIPKGITFIWLNSLKYKIKFRSYGNVGIKSSQITINSVVFT